MICSNCGHDIVEGTICPNCGFEYVEESKEIVEEDNTSKYLKLWDVFARVGFGLSIATFITTFVTMGFMIFYNIIALVLSCLGKKSIEYNKKANTGFKLSLVSTILSVVFIIFVIVALIIFALLVGLGVITTTAVIGILAYIFIGL